MPNEQDLELIAASPLFDAEWYAARYPDVALSGLPPPEHYLRVGARLGRDPGPCFSVPGYLGRYPDVARAGVDPLLHYERSGRAEGRRPVAQAVAQGRAEASAPLPGEVAVDVVVPVFNALEEVRACLAALARVPSGLRSRVLVVNDGSDAETTEWLRGAVRALATPAVAFKLIEHEGNKGYTAAANTGLRASRARFVVLLNSDTVVTPFWLDGLVRCVTSSPEIGIAGPLSNAASWQNVPELLAEDGGFAVNALPPDLGPDQMAALVSRVSGRRYPRTPFVNGFCYMIRREVMGRVGLMDEEAFPTGYGEENDYSIRAREAGFALAIADDTYVFHAKSRSFGAGRRVALSKAGSQALKAKHSPEKVEALLAEVRDTRAMDAVRARIREALEELRTPVARGVRDLAFAQRILFLLPVAPVGGGVHSVIQEVAAMRRMGVEAQAAVKQEHLDRFRQAYREVPEIGDLLVGFTPTDLVAIAARFDVVVATVSPTVRTVARIVRTCPWILPAYYVQDYEPLFFPPGSDDWREAHRSYALLPGAVLFAKTDWVRRKVEEEHGVAVHKVLASIDHAVYRPAPWRPRSDGRLRVAAMIRPQTPRRGAARTMEALRRLKGRYGDRLVVRTFGCQEDDAEFQALPRDFDFEHRGTLARPQVAALLRDTDAFLDLSDYQAFGRTALEAMACGALALVPAAGGAGDYAVDGVNAVVADTSDLDAGLSRLCEVLDDPDRMEAMQLAALRTAAEYSPHRAALSELLVLAPALAAHRATEPPPRRVRVALLPARSEERPRDRLPASSEARVVLPFGLDHLAGRFDVAVAPDGSLPPPGAAELVVLHRDLPAEARPGFEAWHRRFRAAGGRLLYDLDTDPFGPDGSPEDPEGPAGRARAHAARADLVLVPSLRLAERLGDLGDKVRVVPNLIDERVWSLSEARALDPNHARPKPEGQVRIGWLGAPVDGEELRLLAEAVALLRARHGDGVDLEVVAAPDAEPPSFGASLVPPRRLDYQGFARWFQRAADWDVAILPRAEGRPGPADGDLRLIECAALGAALVASDVPDHRGIARPGETCLLVPNDPQAWADALSRLVGDPVLRRRLAEAAFRDVAGRMTLQRHGGLYLSVLDDALKVEP